MRLPPTFRAREPRTAARSGAGISVVCAVVLAVSTAFGPNSVTDTTRAASWAGAAVLAVLGAIALLCDPRTLDRFGAFLGIGVGAVLMTCVLNVITEDPSAAGQAFFAFPVLWVASHLRRGAVVVVTALAVLGDLAALVLLLPVEDAVIDVVFFGAVLVLVATMLVRAGSVQEGLVRALEEQATVDSLTGLLNRRVFDEALEHALDRAPRREGTALVLLDVDSFKQINDRHGHPVGDDALVHLAGLIRRHVRVGDAVLSRLGGDELAVLLPGCSASVAARRADVLLQAVRSTPLRLPDGGLLAVSVSVGVAHAPDHASGVRGLYTAADAALYRAKRAGRDRVEVA
ncbi:GGDEF domain-containing protein [Trujillonella endophytica]|uniref:Diguanylate cyclase (GGDEF) domain-containing protein n=1 Tax=Trujillonella endophytica TaxID=673521 RepID=A0A1H8W5I6_9ACTN|nr:GGDEF domain-containing protein [Trujillella endophytica]SEP22408.1 diguanylate cyclase (GGDEF) domain-containing protein [Trujillella endophytica]